MNLGPPPLMRCFSRVAVATPRYSAASGVRRTRRDLMSTAVPTAAGVDNGFFTFTPPMVMKNTTMMAPASESAPARAGRAIARRDIFWNSVIFDNHGEAHVARDK